MRRFVKQKSFDSINTTVCQPTRKASVPATFKRVDLINTAVCQPARKASAPPTFRHKSSSDSISCLSYSTTLEESPAAAFLELFIVSNDLLYAQNV